MIVALGKLSNEDPSLRIIVDNEINQTKIAGMGELHLDIIIDRLKREYNLDVEVGRPQVAYKETITISVKSEGKYIKQTGGKGQYGHVLLEINPNIENSGFSFENKIVGGAIPKEYIPAVKKGIQESLHFGIIGGFPIVDVSVILYDGSYHEVDSNEMAFKIAGSIAFKKGTKVASPIILEPIMNTEIISPEEWMGEVISDISSRRGRIKNIKDRFKIKLISCLVPLSEMFGFSNDLRSKTQGRATYTMEFDGYKKVPDYIRSKLINKDK
jgi:elongation factor G